MGKRRELKKVLRELRKNTSLFILIEYDKGRSYKNDQGEEVAVAKAKRVHPACPLGHGPEYCAKCAQWAGYVKPDVIWYGMVVEGFCKHGREEIKEGNKNAKC